MPGWGRLHIECPIPFLAVYRLPAAPDPGTDRLVVGTASHLRIGMRETPHEQTADLVRALADWCVQRFGAFLMLEVWAGPPVAPLPDGSLARPRFEIRTPAGDGLEATVEALVKGLARVKVGGRSAEVFTETGGRLGPPGRALLGSRDRKTLGADVIGIEVSPVFRDADGELFPIVLRAIRRRFARTLNKAFYEYLLERTSLQPAHYFQIGRSSLVKAVWEVDQALADVSDAFDLLLQVTPVNMERAWSEFRRSRYEKAPRFRYRPLPADPDSLKRALFAIDLERIEDPTLIHLFHDKRLELDRQLSLLRDIGTRRFRYGSLQLHGTVDDGLRETAELVLAKAPTGSRRDRSERLDAGAFAALARQEIERYRALREGFDATVEIRDDLYAGLLTSGDRLLVSRDLTVSRLRAEALVHHEVGTHLLTYFNGAAQPLRLLHAGLPGYDALQEGLAVLSEYLVGGLDAARLRTLAARVLCVDAMIAGATFVEAFRLLVDEHRFGKRAAFTIAARVYRAGGFAKDKMYLEGLVGLLGYLQRGGDYETLLAGKFSATHVPIVRELMLRGVLEPVPFRPTYLEDATASDRLESLRDGTDVLGLLKR
jgi:uncharacterized protein (TIGR02421 family)